MHTPRTPDCHDRETINITNNPVVYALINIVEASGQDWRIVHVLPSFTTKGKTNFVIQDLISQ